MTTMDERVQEHRRRRMIGLVAVLFGLAVLGTITTQSMGEDLVYYWSPTELRAKSDQAVDATVRLGGMVDRSSTGTTARRWRFASSTAARPSPFKARCLRRCSARASAWWSRASWVATVSSAAPTSW